MATRTTERAGTLGTSPGTRPLWVQLRERRRELGMSARQAADACGVSQGAYSRYENGRAPAESALDGIAAFLGLTRAEVVLARSAEYVEQGSSPRPTRDSLLARLEHLEAEVAAIRRARPEPPAAPPAPPEDGEQRPPSNGPPRKRRRGTRGT